MTRVFLIAAVTLGACAAEPAPHRPWSTRGDPGDGSLTWGDAVPDDDGATADHDDGDPYIDLSCDLPPGTETAWEYIYHIETENVEEAVAVTVTRATNYPICAGGCTYAGIRMHVVRDGSSVCIVDPAQITYVSTYHNWNDTVTGIHAGTRHFFTIELDTVWTYTITASDDGTAAVLWGPVSLTPK